MTGTDATGEAEVTKREFSSFCCYFSPSVITRLVREAACDGEVDERNEGNGRPK